MSYEVTPTVGQNAVTGSIPPRWVGVDLPNGDATPWLEMPLGTEYLYKPDELTNPKRYVKRAVEDRDDDWSLGLHCVQQRVSYADFTDGGSTSGTLALTEKIPAGAWVQQTILLDVTGFTGDTSATIQVGDGTDVDRYSTSTPSVFTTAVAIDVGVPSGTKVHTAEKTVTITITSGSDFTSVVAGAFTIRIYYLL